MTVVSQPHPFIQEAIDEIDAVIAKGIERGNILRAINHFYPTGHNWRRFALNRACSRKDAVLL